MRSRSRRIMAAVGAVALLATACRGGEDGGDANADPGDEVATEDAGTEATTDDGGGPGDFEGVNFDVGVTEEPCPDAVNEDNGCIYLGLISDLTEGPYAPVSVPVTEAQNAFWQHVNDEGGIAGRFDVNVSEYTRDNKYSPEEHSRVYNEIEPHVLALAQSLGSPTTASVIDDMLANDVLATPGGWTSLYVTDDPGSVILESGASYCVESMNAVDYFVEQNGSLETVTIIYVPGDYGADAAAGARHAAENHGAQIEMVEVGPTASGGELQGAISGIVSGDPDLVIPAVSPGQTAEIVGGAVAGGYAGRFIGPGPTWNPGLLDSPAADALLEHYWQSRPWAEYDADTPGHQTMREVSGEQDNVNWGYTAGWIWSYPLKAALEQAVENGDLTRAGLVAAVGELTSVDYQGMLPDEAGNYTGSPDEQLFRQSLIAEPVRDSVEGTVIISDFYEGPTVQDFTFEEACYEAGTL